MKGVWFAQLHKQTQIYKYDFSRFESTPAKTKIIDICGIIPEC